MSSNESVNSVRYSKSIEAHTRRSRVIAGGVNSNVRLISRPVPLTFSRADGAMIWDLDDNEYIDYAGGMGRTEGTCRETFRHPCARDCDGWGVGKAVGGGGGGREKVGV